MRGGLLPQPEASEREREEQEREATDARGLATYAAFGSDAGLVAGQSVWAQFWSRDPADPSGTNLTDAIGFTLCD